jgi:hypothetical protein
MTAAFLAGPLLVVSFLAGTPRQDGGRETDAKPSIQESLVRPFVIPFREPTSLERLTEYLASRLSGPVVLDRAALTRLELRPDDTVQLELEGVRLKTALQLLLDQVGMTYRVVPEDNLLILTDSFGADDPYERILDEIETLHRELHDLRDAVDDLHESIAAGGAEGTMRKPTIIEEIPGGAIEKPKVQEPEASPGESHPRTVRPGAATPKPDTGPGGRHRVT